MSSGNAPARAAPSAITDADFVRNDVAAPKVSGRVALDDGVELVVVLSPRDEDRDPDLAMALVARGAVLSRLDGFKAIAGASVSDVGIGGCESWGVSPKRIALGKVGAVRLDIACSGGEDNRHDTEAAILFRLAEPAPKSVEALARIYGGAGSSHLSVMDACDSLSTVDFRWVDDKTLEKSTVEAVSWVDQDITKDLKDSIRRGCKVGKTRRVERIKLK